MNVRNEIREHNRNLDLNPPTDRTYYQNETGKVSKRKPATIKRTVRARSIREAMARCNMAQASEVSEARKDGAFVREVTSKSGFGTMAKALLDCFGPRAIREVVKA